MRRRKNPHSSTMLILLLVGGGIAALLLTKKAKAQVITPGVTASGVNPQQLAQDLRGTPEGIRLANAINNLNTATNNMVIANKLYEAALSKHTSRGYLAKLKIRFDEARNQYEHAKAEREAAYFQAQ